MRLGVLAVVLWSFQLAAAATDPGGWRQEVVAGAGRRLVRGDPAAPAARLIVKVAPDGGTPGAHAPSHALDALARGFGSAPRSLLPPGVVTSRRRSAHARPSFDRAGLGRLYVVDAGGADVETLAPARAARCPASSGASPTAR
jgi:hypothetical protein